MRYGYGTRQGWPIFASLTTTLHPAVSSTDTRYERLTYGYELRS
jgi:hypothetical protein